MRPVIRHMRPDEMDAFAAVLELSAGRHAVRSRVGSNGDVDASRALGAFAGSRLVGGTGWVPIELTVPGGAIAEAAKITLTALLPTHRQQGLASEFMRRQLSDLQQSGISLAVLTTAQSGVPARHGFGAATFAAGLDITPGRVGADSDETASLGLVSIDEASEVLPAIYDEHRLRQPGQVSRSKSFWSRWFLDDPFLRIGTGDRFFLLARDAHDRCVGYLTYRLTPGVLREQPVAELVVEDLIALTVDSRLAIWSYCLGFGQAARVAVWNVPVDDPVRWMRAAQRSVRLNGVREFLRLRIVDVATALALRRYSIDASFVLDIRDDVLPANHQRFRLTCGPDTAYCEVTGADADLSLDVGSLAAAYLGGVDLTTLAGAGLVTERTAGTLRQAELAFSWRPLPWTVTDW